MAREQIFSIHDAAEYLAENDSDCGAAAIASDKFLAALKTAIVLAKEDADKILCEHERVVLRYQGTSIAHPVVVDVATAEAEILAVAGLLPGISRDHISKAVLLYKQASASTT